MASYSKSIKLSQMFHALCINIAGIVRASDNNGENSSIILRK